MIDISQYTEANKEKGRYCVYKLLDENKEVLYVGKSKRFKHRIYDHLRGNSHIGKKCKDLIKYVEYLEFPNECDMNIFEICAISYYQPPYNIENKSKINLIQINMPKKWNKLDVNSFDEVQYEDGFINPHSNEIPHFNKELFLNEKLSQFLDEHYFKILTNDDILELQTICNISDFNISEINNYIAYNNSKAELTEESNKDIKLIRRKKGKDGYGTLGETQIGNNLYMCYRVLINGKRLNFYGKTREELANKICNYSNILKIK